MVEELNSRRTTTLIQNVITAGLEPGTSGLPDRRAGHSVMLPPCLMLFLTTDLFLQSLGNFILLARKPKEQKCGSRIKWPNIRNHSPGIQNQCKKRSHSKRRLKMIVRISAEMNRIVVRMMCASTTCAEFITWPMFSHYIFCVNIFPSVLQP